MVQSPISISLQNTNIDDKVKPLKFFDHWTTNCRAIIENTGKTVQLTFQVRSTAEQRPHIIGGPLKSCERYIFEQMHFHWSDNDHFGSEHRINQRTYSMEAHLVHFNEKYGNFNRAIEKKDGLVVVAFFIQAFGNTECKFFRKISDSIRKIRIPGSKCTLDSDCLLWIALQELNKHYYTYSGSLTTPPYNECVTWIIYQAPVFVSKQQVAVFRDLLSDNENENIRNNCRPIQTVMPNDVPSIAFTRNVARLKSKL